MGSRVERKVVPLEFGARSWKCCLEVEGGWVEKFWREGVSAGFQLLGTGLSDLD